ncbi:MAG: polymer-forming cytoskeletal protein [Patescibacteria group bacterium]|jgi:cytoskeletal protein CcmA (bactofilin family)
MPSNQNEVAGPGTVVGANVKLVGTIQDKNNISIHGSVEGEVNSEKAIDIAVGAKIKGPVTGQIVKVAGNIQGSVTAKERLEILPTGKIVGSVSTKDLIINSGAIFVGKSSMPSSGLDEEVKSIEKQDKEPESE